MSDEVNMIQTLRKFRGGASPSKFGGGQSRDIFRGVPVKKITLYPAFMAYCLGLVPQVVNRKAQLRRQLNVVDFYMESIWYCHTPPICVDLIITRNLQQMRGWWINFSLNFLIK